MHELYELKDKLCKELKKYSDKELTKDSLELVDKLSHARTCVMNQTTIDNFIKLSPQKQEELIVLIQKLLVDYQLLFSDPHSTTNNNM